MADLRMLEEALGYFFHDSALLRQALTHPSHGPKHNQRLEFLGDAVLEICVSERIYARHPEMQEGAMTRLRQKLVREEKLAEAALKINLGKYLLMDKSCAATGGRQNPSVLSDAFEAVLAAVYLDGGGLKATGEIVEALIGDCTDTGESDPKSALQEYLQGKGMNMPSYETVDEQGPPHDRHFTAAALVDGKELARGQGTSKKRAEQEAARAALIMIKQAGE